MNYMTGILIDPFLKKLTSDFKSFRFELHHTLLDVRIFDWWNFGKKNKKEKIFSNFYKANE